MESTSRSARAGRTRRAWCRRPSRTASATRVDSAETVTVTLPVHPLVGHALAVVRFVRHGDGRRYVDLQHPHGHVFRLPESYTDRAAPTVAAEVAGRGLRATVQDLLRVAAVVGAAEVNENMVKLDRSSGRERTWPEPEQRTGYNAGPNNVGGWERSPGGLAAVDRAAGVEVRSERRRAGRAGEHGSQALVPGGTEQGGRR